MVGLPHASYLCPVTIGRTAEMDSARAFLQGVGGVLLISGEAGVGKSRLVREARAHAEANGVRVLEGRAFEADRALPFAPALDVLRNLADRYGIDEIVRLAGPATRELARLMPELDPGESMPSQGGGDPKTARRRLHDGFARLLTGVAAGGRLLLIVEDIHWLDASSLELLLHLARHSTSLLLVMTYRGDELHPDLEHLLATLDRERLASEIRLNQFDAGHVAAMLQAILATPNPVPASLLHAVVALTEGNPYFVEEVLSTLGAEQDVRAPDGQWLVADQLNARIPRSVQDAIRRRLAGISPEAQSVLTQAAVAGRRFDFDLLSALSGHDEGELLVIMRELIAAQLVVEEQGDRFAFRHALTRESIYAGLLDREKRRLHRRIADAIEQLQISSSDQRLDDLARHAFAACTWPLALEACHRAGMRAAALHAPRAAADHFANAIDAARAVGQPPDAELVRARGRALETLGDFDGARADYDIALAMFRANGNQRDAWQTLLDLALLWSSRDYQRTGEFVAEALAVARELGDPAAVASSLNRAGNWQCNIEEPHRGAKHHREALQIFETLGDERGIAETLDLLGMAGLIGGDQTSGFSAYERAIPVWRRLGDQRGLASALLGLSISCPTFHTSTLPTLRPVGEVRAIGLQSIELCQEIGWRAGECFAKWGFLGMALGACGKYDLAIPGTREALLIAREIEHRQWITGARCILGNLYADLGDLPAARVELEAALALAQEIGSLYWTRSARGWLASILVCANQLDEAETLLHAEPAADVPTTIAGRLLRAAAAEHVLARGNPEEAIAAIDVLVATIPDGTRRTPTRLERLRGEALVALGDYDAALVVLTAAREEASWSGARPQFWRIDAALSRLHLLRGEQDESQRAAIAARMLVADLAMCVPDDVLREALLAVAERELPAIHAPEVVAASDRPGSPLTRREREVAFLLTEGLTNREIGVRLFLSEWTVATHVRNILAKLDLSTRAQIAAWAARQDAAPPA